MHISCISLSLLYLKQCLLCACMLSCFSWVRLFVDCSLSGSSVHGILQARVLEWVAMPFSKGSSQSRD